MQFATKFSVKSGANKAGVLVYNSGKIHVEGAESELKKWLTELKVSIESGAAAPASSAGRNKRIPSNSTRARACVRWCSPLVLPRGIEVLQSGKSSWCGFYARGRKVKQFLYSSKAMEIALKAKKTEGHSLAV